MTNPENSPETNFGKSDAIKIFIARCTSLVTRLKKEIRLVDKINIVIAILTLSVLGYNLHLFWAQNKFTETLNQPLCAVKQLKASKVTNIPNVVEISVVIANLGNYVARNAYVESKLYTIKYSGGKEQSRELINGWQPQGIKDITILPRHEFDYFLVYVDKAAFNKKVEGYNSLVEVEVIIKYKDLRDKAQQYSCLYRITRLLGEDYYDAILINSNQGEYTEQPQKADFLHTSPEIPNTATPSMSTVIDASPNATLKDMNSPREQK